MNTWFRLLSLPATLVWLSSPALARQNTVIGEVSLGYDFQERQYDEGDVNEGEQEEVVAEETATTPEVIVIEDRRGDRRRWFVSPRVRFGSQGLQDLFEFTYAPLLSYDDLYDENEVDHSLNLLFQKDFSRNWSIKTSNSFYYGEDPVLDKALRTETIIPGQEAVEETPVVGSEPEEESDQELSETFGRRRFWRNDLSLSTDYTYGQDSFAGLGYNFGLLRNIDGNPGGYSDYDRHEGSLRFGHRFSKQWQTEITARYVKGIYDEQQVVVVRPGEETGSDASAAEGDGESAAVAEPTPERERLDDLDEDLQEYHGVLRLNYDWQASDQFFGKYRYSSTDYEALLREDSTIHEFSLGWNHDFSRQLRMTLSGGPSLVSYSNSDRANETDVNGLASLTWETLHGALNLSAEGGLDYENFDGRRSGLTQFWRSGASYSYQFTPALSTVLSAGYRNNRRNQSPSTGTVEIVDDGTLPEPGSAEAAELEEKARQALDREYTEDIYDAGITLSYTFMRWYTLSSSYRYYNNRSGGAQDYDEHRVLITLSASKDLFRW
ncbi:porin family protein [Desulfogranum mediterraneum]|uniref:hypothetical protein n=1 Tax=Desulfogranum mediterraneum TaxID=160661 RepID=UPI0004240CD9|nr:hypothetical protein [Desulfogranum mediterraneum]